MFANIRFTLILQSYFTKNSQKHICYSKPNEFKTAIFRVCGIGFNIRSRVQRKILFSAVKSYHDAFILVIWYIIGRNIIW